MKKIFFLILCFSPLFAFTQPTGCSKKDSNTGPKQKIGIVVYSGDPETVWNAFRFGNFALGEGDTVKVFLLGKGVESEALDNDKFKVTDQLKQFVENGGKTFACGTCLTIRKMEGSKMCPLSTMQDMYDIFKWCNKVITF